MMYTLLVRSNAPCWANIFNPYIKGMNFCWRKPCYQAAEMIKQNTQDAFMFLHSTFTGFVNSVVAACANVFNHNRREEI